jgi:hypothetical protein
VANQHPRKYNQHLIAIDNNWQQSRGVHFIRNARRIEYQFSKYCMNIVFNYTLNVFPITLLLLPALFVFVSSLLYNLLYMPRYTLNLLLNPFLQ